MRTGWRLETARSATYASIPAGHHIFRVQASSPEGVWNSQSATVALAVYPYFWQTSWFLAAVTAALAGGGVWSFRRATVRRLGRRVERLRQQHAVQQERARIAQDIHDELGANLTSIGLLADIGTRHKADPAALARDLDHISQTARSSVAAMDAIVWALNPRNDSLDHFANYVAQFTRDFFRPTPVADAAGFAGESAGRSRWPPKRGTSSFCWSRNPSTTSCATPRPRKSAWSWPVRMAICA